MNIKGNILIILFISIFFFLNCKNNPQEETSILQKAESITNNAINFDKVLKDCDFSFEETYFITADYGCIYNPKGENNFGNLIIYLIPKTHLNIPDEQIEAENKRINNMNVDSYKSEFNIFVYLVDSKELNYNKLGDPIYYHKENYREMLYTYNNKTNKWLLLDSINILNKNSNDREQDWRESFIKKMANNSYGRKNETTIDNISEKWIGSYSLIINENSKDWRDTQDITLDINKDSVIYSVEGYQIYQKYKLSAIENNNTLKLKFQSALDDTDSAVLEKTKDFGEMVYDGKNYNWTCPYIDISFMDKKKITYILSKK